MSIKPDLRVSHAIAQSIADRVLSHQTVASIAKIHGGEIAAVYEIGLVGGKSSLVLKVYPQSLHWKMRKEANVIALIGNQISVPIPHILLVDDSKQLLDLNFTLMTKLDGMGLGSIERTLPQDQFASAYRQIGTLLREFHQIPMEAFGYIGPNGIWTAYPTNHAYITFQFKRKLMEFQQRGGQEALALRVAGYVAEHDTLLRECQQSVLCHNDLHAGNLLAKSDSGAIRLCGVLDFEGALAGDPLMDVAKAAYYLRDDARRALLDGYGDLGRASGPEVLRLYHLYFVLELWCWMAQIGNPAPLEKLARELDSYSSVTWP
jgi:hygromycin-B 7''-O-kinase